MLVQTLALMVSLSSGISAASCNEPPRLLVEVQAKHDPVAVATNLSLAEIHDFWQRSGSPGRHEPRGFYAGGFTSTVQVDVPKPGTCPAQVSIRVSMLLTNRRIEVGRELLATPCLYTAAVAHYRLIATADDTLFSAFAERVRAAIPNELRKHTQGALPTGINGRSRIEKIINSTLASEYQSYRAGLAAARNQVDTAEEVRKPGTCEPQI